MSNKMDGPTETKSFRPNDLQRILETVSEHGHPTRNDVGLMIAEDLRHQASLAPGPVRKAEILDDLKALDAVIREKTKKGSGTGSSWLLAVKRFLKKLFGWRRGWI